MTDHVHNQLCQRIEELEAEKLELNEQLDIVQRAEDEFVEGLVGILSKEFNTDDESCADVAYRLYRYGYRKAEDKRQQAEGEGR